MSASTSPIPVSPGRAPAPAASSSKPNNTRRNAIIAAVLLLGVGGAVAALFAFRRPAPPPPLTQPLAAMKFAASDQWKSLTPDQLSKYYDDFDKMSMADRMKFFGEMQKLTDDERSKAMENFMGTRMVMNARKYIAMTPTERVKELDRQIDQQQGMFANFRPPAGTSRPSGPGGGGGPRGWGNPSAMKGRMENTNPGDRAAMAQFIADMSARRAARGLGGGPGPGGGGGGAPRAPGAGPR